MLGFRAFFYIFHYVLDKSFRKDELQRIIMKDFKSNFIGKH